MNISTVSVDSKALTNEMFFPHMLVIDAVVKETLLHDRLLSMTVSTVSKDSEALTKEMFFPRTLVIGAVLQRDSYTTGC